MSIYSEMILTDADDAESLPKNLLEKMSAACDALCAAQGLDGTRLQISVSFVSEEEIREYNRDYRGVDDVTDVLSFPQYESIAEVRAVCKSTAVTNSELHPVETTGVANKNSHTADISAPILLGDVVICLPRAREQAENYGHSDAREIVYLFVHSVLHLLAYDHETEHEKHLMRAAEEAVMEQIGLGAPARGETSTPHEHASQKQ